MPSVHACCCGLDVHTKRIVACLRRDDGAGQRQKELRTVGTMTPALLALVDWLTATGCTQVAMESTGVDGKPVSNRREGLFEILVVNAHHLKAVPGRKTGVKDAEGIADLWPPGLLRGSFIPPAPPRDLRALTRHRRTLVAERARIVNRLPKVLEDANLKLAAVARDIAGVSARTLLQGLIEGGGGPNVMGSNTRWSDGCGPLTPFSSRRISALWRIWPRLLPASRPNCRRGARRRKLTWRCSRPFRV